MLETLVAAARPGGAEPSVVAELGSVELWRGLTILDLYAGTGALGIEALSRGAAWCDFVEADSSARRIIERNLRTTGLAERAHVLGIEVDKVLQGTARDALHAPYALVLMDPPYADASVGKNIERLGSGDLLVPDSLVTVEHSRRQSLAPTYLSVATERDRLALVEARQRRHGDTIISIYRWTSFGDRGVDGHGYDGDLPRQL